MESLYALTMMVAALKMPPMPTLRFERPAIMAAPEAQPAKPAVREKLPPPAHAEWPLDY